MVDLRLTVTSRFVRQFVDAMEVSYDEIFCEKSHDFSSLRHWHGVTLDGLLFVLVDKSIRQFTSMLNHVKNLLVLTCYKFILHGSPSLNSIRKDLCIVDGSHHF
jgi:hypothetical protein